MGDFVPGVLSFSVFGTHKIWGILSQVNFCLGDFVMGDFVTGDFVVDPNIHVGGTISTS